MCGALASRLRTIRVIKSLWNKDLHSAAIDQLATVQDGVMVLNILGSIGLLAEQTPLLPAALTMRHCGQVLAMLRPMILSTSEKLSAGSMTAITNIINSFGVQISVGHRLSKVRNDQSDCRSAHSELVAIKKTVVSDAGLQKSKCTAVRQARRMLIQSFKTTAIQLQQQ